MIAAKMIRGLAHIAKVAVTMSTPGRLWKRDGHWWELVKEVSEGPSAP